MPAGNVAAPAGMLAFQTRSYKLGWLTRDYPNIPSQQFLRQSTERLESVDLRVPRGLHIAYVKGTDDVQSPLGQLQINVQAFDPSLLAVIDLTGFSTVLIGSGALEGDALAMAVPSLREFMRKGGTVVVMPGGQEVANSGLLPYPLTFDSIPARVSDPAGEVRTLGARAPSSPGRTRSRRMTSPTGPASARAACHWVTICVTARRWRSTTRASSRPRPRSSRRRSAAVQSSTRRYRSTGS